MATVTTDPSASGQVRLDGTNNNDTINAHDYADVRQTHVYAKDGNDTVNMYFGAGNYYRSSWQHQHKEYQGHHVRGGDGSDIFNFAGLSSVNQTVIGRVEDFDISRDTLKIEGEAITPSQLANGYGSTGGYSWKIVEWSGDHNDPNSTSQQWLLIDTGPGWVFYALEGARVDMTGDGAANSGDQEGHFFTNAPPNFSTMPSVAYLNPQNFVPAGVSAQGGLIINDYDGDAADVLTQLNGSSSGDLIAGGLNDDSVSANGGNDQVWGGSGHDTIDGGSGNDSLYGGTGSDSLIGGDGNDAIYTVGAASNGYGEDTASGGGGDDQLIGSNGADWLYGDAGNDTLNGGEDYSTADVDFLYGGDGNDLLISGQGTTRADHQHRGDQLFGDAGNDTLEGGQADDHLEGGVGDDSITGGAGNDVINTGTIGSQTVGNDTAAGGDGDDEITGSNASDWLYGDAGNDTLNGGDDWITADVDYLYGGDGNDLLISGQGTTQADHQHRGDQLFGDAGNDTLEGGQADDHLEGGVGGDIFVFRDDFGDDTVSDFNPGQSGERIDLSNVSAITGFSDLSANHLSQSGSNAVISDGSGNTITLVNVAAGSLSADDFLF